VDGAIVARAQLYVLDGMGTLAGPRHGVWLPKTVALRLALALHEPPLPVALAVETGSGPSPARDDRDPRQVREDPTIQKLSQSGDQESFDAAAYLRIMARNSLVNDQQFRSLSAGKRKEFLDAIDKAAPQDVAGVTAAKLVETGHLVSAARTRAAALDKLARGETPADAEIDSLPALAQVTARGAAKALRENSTGKGRVIADPETRQRIAVETMKVLDPEEASLLAEAALQQKPGGGRDFYDLLIKDPGGEGALHGDTPRKEDSQNLQAILDRLSPRGAAAFIFGITRATNDEVETKDLVSAFFKGVSGSVGAKAGEAKAEGEASAGLGVSLGPLMDAIDKNRENGYSRSLHDTILDFQQTHRAEGNQRPWRAEDEEEFAGAGATFK
jgi:hypothetical protein